MKALPALLALLLLLAMAGCSAQDGESPITPSDSASSPPNTTAATVPQPTASPSPDLERRMREDLAGRLGVAPAALSLDSFRKVTWASGCLGITRPGQVCSQMLVPGFLAIWRDASGNTYRYHGSGESFIAASFEPGATLSEPFPAGP